MSGPVARAGTVAERGHAALCRTRRLTLRSRASPVVGGTELDNVLAGGVLLAAEKSRADAAAAVPVSEASTRASTTMLMRAPIQQRLSAVRNDLSPWISPRARPSWSQPPQIGSCNLPGQVRQVWSNGDCRR
ncbi:hypothetical protein Aca07nite_56350 [Actinoplanes capillaceus]|uniref:Uncharacterized protein n=1 Tax=Actinoplanes campanulatus TaxID=113559 RepID=A0ABQ3WQA5_9ACTN|nr:hypothetical protein Aca07nite_56350 [Actinoplanes capillaceus]